MENIHVVCDVCDCMHNADSCKCMLGEIKITEKVMGQEQKVDTPHYCQSFEQR